MVEKQAGRVDATPSSRSYAHWKAVGDAASTLLRQHFNGAKSFGEFVFRDRAHAHARQLSIAITSMSTSMSGDLL